MPIFISYNRQDSAFVDSLATNLVMRRHNVWLDRWELNVGDSLIGRIQEALTDSSAILVILSKNSVQSEWCKKELNSGLVRELSEKKVVVVPCVIDDCDVPLFFREKVYADFRANPDEAFAQVDNALLKFTNPQQGRLESPNFHTDWSYDWKKSRSSGLWCFDWTFVDHSVTIEYCILTRCQLACNEIATAIFNRLNENQRQKYILRAFAIAVGRASTRHLKIRLSDAFEKFDISEIGGMGQEGWLVEISSRRMGNDTGKDTLIHVDQVLERALAEMQTRSAPRATSN